MIDFAWGFAAGVAVSLFLASTAFTLTCIVWVKTRDQLEKVIEAEAFRMHRAGWGKAEAARYVTSRES